MKYHTSDNCPDKNMCTSLHLHLHFIMLSSVLRVPNPLLQDRACSGHGTCSLGVCYCHTGWSGETCGQRNELVLSCLPDCSHHGTYDLATGHCACDNAWTGQHCNISKYIT